MQNNVILSIMGKEAWKQLISYNQRYWVSDVGDVKSVYKNGRELLLKAYTTQFGYKRIQLKINGGGFKNEFIHVLVAKMFVENPYNKPFVNHKNSIRTDNFYQNLEWCTRSENHLHGFRYGNMSNKGERGTNHAVTEKEVKEIFYSNKTVKELSKIYKVGISGIYKIKSKQTWQHMNL